MDDLTTKTISVLDRGFVELQDVMGDDLAIVNAARVSYLGESKGPDQDKRLLFYLLRNRHSSPFEQVEFKFRLKAPVVVWWQIVRHRTAHLNMQSGRYTPFAEDEFYIPTAWRKQAQDNKQGSEGRIDSQDSRWLTMELISHYDRCHRLYKSALDAGVAKEQARLFLPGFSCYYTGVWKIDAHNLMHFLSLRMDGHAQWEIRQYAEVIHDEFFVPALPWTAEAFNEFL